MGNTNRESTQALFISMMDRLRDQHDPYKPIDGILADTCRFFGFGCGFIYEADHAGLFSLREQYYSYQGDSLPESIILREHLNQKALEGLGREPVVFFPASASADRLGRTLATLFNANSLLLVTLTDNTGIPIGIAGMSDRRGRILLSDEEVDVARSILTVVSHHVKLRMYQRTIENSRKALESILDNMGIDVYVNDFLTHEVLYANSSMAVPYGGKDKLIGNICWKALYDDKTGPCDYCPQQKLLDEEGNPTRCYSWDYQRPFDNSWFRVFSAAFPWTDGRLAHVVSSVDISENKRYEATIRRMAESDNLTGLPNRLRLLMDLEEILESGRRGFVLFFDLDNFKTINDTLGHRAGDELLAGIGKMLSQNPVTAGRCYRHSGDEFVMILADGTREAADRAAAFLLEQFSRPWHLRDGSANFGSSIGIVSFPQEGLNAEEIIHRADMAMYVSKKSGKNKFTHYDDDILSCTL